MSAWIRSVTGRAYHFKPLNAKQLERPSPFLPLLEVFERVGCELVEETSQGFNFRPHSSKHRAGVSGGANPLSPTIFLELKPQETGTGLLIRFGEVATTSGSTSVFCRVV
jgi:hypothetical protein